MSLKQSKSRDFNASTNNERLADVNAKAKNNLTSKTFLTALLEQAGTPIAPSPACNWAITTVLTALRLSGQPYQLSHGELVDQRLLGSQAITNVCQKIESIGLIVITASAGNDDMIMYKLTLQGIAIADKVLVNTHRIN